jgi:hypothetical protein
VRYVNKYPEFSEAVLSLEGDQLRLSYVLLHNTNLINLIVQQTKDTFSKGKDHFIKFLESEAEKISDKDEKELRLDLFLTLLKRLDIRGDRFDFKQEFDNKCDEIVEASYAILLNNKEFAESVSKMEEDNSIKKMMLWQLEQMLQKLDKDLAKASSVDDSKKNDFRNSVFDYVDSLPIEQKKEIYEKLGLKDHSEKGFNLLLSSSPGLVFSTIVQVLGFTAYTTLSSSVAAFAGLFGLTLPFGFYTGMSTFVAFATGPLAIFALAASGWMMFRNNEKVKKELIPIIIMQIAAPAFFGEKQDQLDSFESFSYTWSERYSSYKRFAIDLKASEEQQILIKSAMLKKQISIKEINEKIVKYNGDIESLKQNVKHRLESENLGLDLQKIYRENGERVSNLKDEKAKLESVKGFFKSIFSSDIAQINQQLSTLQKENEELMGKMIEEVLTKDTNLFIHERNIATRLYKGLETNKRSDLNKKNELQELKTELDKYEKQASFCKNKMKTLAERTYGLDHIAINSVSV